VRYVLSALRAGVAGLDLHTLPDRCGSYTALCAPTAPGAAAGFLRAQPSYYALLLIRHLTGEHLLRTRMTSPSPGLTVDALAVRSRRRVDVVVVNSAPSGSPPAELRLLVGGRGASGTVLRLTGPALEATSGITLGGAAVTPHGRWRPGRSASIAAASGSIDVGVPAGSAALVRVRR
jgi:hypothetical protein